MVEAFGATLTNLAGSSFSGCLEKIWERSALLRGKIYRVPGGSVGRQFTAELAMEYELLALGKQNQNALRCSASLYFRKIKTLRNQQTLEG